MTFDPHRHESQRAASRHSDQYRTEDRTAAGASILLAAMLLAAIGGFIFFYTGTDKQVATNDARPTVAGPSTTGVAPAPETTGSSANMPPAPEPKLEPKVKPVE